jgi:SAM-dependent methyltransferase
MERLSFIRRSFESILVLGDFDVSLIQEETPFQENRRVIQLNGPSPLFPELRSPVADTDFLPFRSSVFDLVISYFDLHMINDVPGTLSQIKQVLKPDGFFLGVFLGGESLWQLRRICTQAEAEISQGVSPRVSPMMALYDAAGLLQRAGFALPVADHEKVDQEYPSVLAMLEDLKMLGLTNCLSQQQRGLMGKNLFRRLLDLYRMQSKIACCYDIVFVSGWCPSHTQQKPLQRGTASLHLSHVLS